MPKRLQQKRTRGWRMPENGRGIGRPSRWGNFYRVEDGGFNRGFIVAAYARFSNGERLMYENWTAPNDGYWTKKQAIQKSLALFRQYAEERAAREPEWLEPLRGKDLYCWCPEGASCHGDILIELSNR